MTRGQRSKLNERYRQKWENAFYEPILKALKSQISSFTSDVKNYGLSTASSRLSGQVFNDKMALVISKLYRIAGLDSANRTLKALKQEATEKRSTFGFNAEWTQEIQDYFRLHLFNKVVAPITETTREQIARKINEMIERGESIEWLVQQLQSDELTAWRVRMIARTESNRAINNGAQMAVSKSKFKVVKEWVAVHDSRTRHSHSLLDGKVVAENEEFKPGLKYPGDPNGSAKETINCRCHAEYRLLRDKKGRLIPKQGGRIIVSSRARGLFNDLIDALKSA